MQPETELSTKGANIRYTVGFWSALGQLSVIVAIGCHRTSTIINSLSPQQQKKKRTPFLKCKNFAYFWGFLFLKMELIPVFWIFYCCQWYHVWTFPSPKYMLALQHCFSLIFLCHWNETDGVQKIIESIDYLDNYDASMQKDAHDTVLKIIFETYIYKRRGRAYTFTRYMQESTKKYVTRFTHQT